MPLPFCLHLLPLGPSGHVSVEEKKKPLDGLHACLLLPRLCSASFVLLSAAHRLTTGKPPQRDAVECKWMSTTRAIFCLAL